jgi:succinate dehydrogenase / fumarate reductase cytochrome b subunit
MQRVVTLTRSTVGKKVLMAASGTLLFLFVLAHMGGNLKMLQGCHEAAPGEHAAGLSVDGYVCSMDSYAEFLREVGYPAVPHGTVLWLARLALLGAVGVHVVAAFQLWQRSSRARGGTYKKQEAISFSYASRTMRWGGVIILAFIVYHILHFTTGQAHVDYVYGGVYRNFVVAFQNPLVLGAYFVAQAALCLHLYHGVWSVFQTLGANHPKYNHLRRPFAAAYAGVVFIGFLIPPVLVFAGVLGLPG